MPFEPESPFGGFTGLTEEQSNPPEYRARMERDTGQDSMLGTIGKVAAPVAIGAGLLLAPEVTIPALAVAGGGALLADPENAKSAFRQENTIGSALASNEVRYALETQGVFGGRVKIDPDYDPWADIVDTKYETYADKFAVAGNRDHANAIKADIDRETKDRDTIAKSGLIGIGASMAAGMFDPTILVPGGAIVRR